MSKDDLIVLRVIDCWGTNWSEYKAELEPHELEVMERDGYTLSEVANRLEVFLQERDA